LIGTIYLKHTHLILRDVDGSEERLMLEDALEVLAFLAKHKHEIEERAEANWQKFITKGGKPDQEQ